MGEIVRKVRPTDYWRIGEHESWFSDMALEGYYFVKMGTHFAHFKKGEPRKMEYRIEVTDNKRISNEQIDLYEDNGWNYITSYQYFHIFASPEERLATEIHTDPAEQAFTLQSLIKKFRFNTYAVSICILLLIGILSALWFLEDTPFLSMVEGFLIQETLITIVILYSFYTVIRGMISIRMLQMNLNEGKAINHSAPWRKKIKINQIASIFFIIFALGCAVLPFIQILKSETLTLPVEDTTLPFVRLVDIEQNEQLERDVYMIEGGVDQANQYSTNWSIFAPVQYDVNEVGIVENLKWADGSGTYSPSINSEIYKLKFEVFSSSLITDLVKRHSYDIDDKTTIEQNHPAFDRLITKEENVMKEIYASKGNVVIFVRYNGNAKMEKVVDQVAEKINLVK